MLIDRKIKMKQMYLYSGTKRVVDSFIKVFDSSVENDDSDDLALLSSLCVPSNYSSDMSYFARIGCSYVFQRFASFYYNNRIYDNPEFFSDVVGLTCTEMTISPSSESMLFINTEYNPLQLIITLNPPYYFSNTNFTTVYPKDTNENTFSLLTFKVLSGSKSINNYQINPILLFTIFDGVSIPKLLSCRMKDEDYVMELIFHKKCVMKGVEINKPFKMNDTELLIFDPSTTIDILYYIWINDFTLNVYYNSATEEVGDFSTIPIELRTPVPKVISCSFSNDLTVNIKFDREIKEGIDANGRRCIEIFNDTSFNPLSICYLSSNIPNVIIMELINPSKLAPNDYLHFIPNILKSSKNHVKGCEGNIIVLADGDYTIQPTITLPKAISPCYDFIIDGRRWAYTISRPLMYYWSSSNETLNNILSFMEGPMIIIPKNTLEVNSSYDITLNTISTFGYQTNNKTEIFHVGSDLMLNVVIEGDNEYSFYTNPDVYIRGRVSLYQCDKNMPKPEINYNWLAKDGYGNAIDLSKYKIVDETRLYFGVNSIEPGDRTLTLSYSVNGFRDEESIDIRTEMSLSIVSETYPTYLSQNRNESIVIDLSFLGPADIVPEPYFWECKFNKIFFCDGFYGDRYSPRIEISSSALKIGVYEISTIVDLLYSDRFSKTYVREVNDLPFSFFIQNPKSNSSVYNQKDLFQLECVTSMNNVEIKYNWIYSNSENVNPFVGKTNNYKVNINCENLKPQLTHKIVLELKYKDKKIEAFYEFTINQGPYNGYLSSSTLNYRFGDNIILSTMSWKGKGNHFSYRFGVIINNSTYYLQAQYGLADYYFGPLPLGSSQCNYTLIPIVFVKDKYGTVTNTTLGRDGNVIKIYSPPLELTDLLNIMGELGDVIDDLRNEKYYDYTNPITEGISTQMKCLYLRCENGAKCLDGHCLCLDGFYGDLCENRIDIDDGLSSG